MATLLGLLLVVTFIANFLTTVVPNQMQVNDLNHEVTVESQFSRLAALLSAATANGPVGMQIVQPITLGSAAVAPWVAQDGSSIGSARNGTGVALTYGLLGTQIYQPPSGIPTSHVVPAGCTTTAPSTQISCSGATPFVYNLSSNAAKFTVTDSGSGRGAFNISGSNSLVVFSMSGSGALFMQILGSQDTIFLNGTGSAPTNIWVVGSNDTVSVTATGSGLVTIHVIGNHDTVTMVSDGASGAVIYSVFGTNDTLSALTDTGSGNLAFYLNGFNPSNATSPSCPYDNLSHFNSVGTVTHTGSGTVSEIVNNTAGYTATGTGSWGGTVTYQNVVPFACPFFAPQQITIHGPSVAGTGPALFFDNLYAPSGEVAVDAGAVVFAQYGAYPVFVQKPSIALSVQDGNVTAASVWFPYFLNKVGAAAGTGTQTIDARLLRSSTFVINNTSAIYSFNPNVPITLTVATPYAEAWDAWLAVTPAFAGLWSCAPVTTCTGTYNPGGPLGVVTISIPTTNLQVLKTSSATFSLSLS